MWPEIGRAAGRRFFRRRGVGHCRQRAPRRQPPDAVRQPQRAPPKAGALQPAHSDATAALKSEGSAVVVVARQERGSLGGRQLPGDPRAALASCAAAAPPCATFAAAAAAAGRVIGPWGDERAGGVMGWACKGGERAALGVSLCETVSSADLGGSSKYSYETYEDRSGDGQTDRDRQTDI